MKTITVKNTSGKIIASAEFNEPDASNWIKHCQDNNLWGAVGTYTVQIVSNNELEDQKKLDDSVLLKQKIADIDSIKSIAEIKEFLKALLKALRFD